MTTTNTNTHNGTDTTTTTTSEMLSSPKEELDVLIVGAGQGGMAAAHRLNRHGIRKLHVIEAHDYVGGRTRNVDVSSSSSSSSSHHDDRYDIANSHAVELGGTWISPCHTAILELCKDLQIKVFLDDGTSTELDPDAAAAAATKGGDTELDWPWWYWGPAYTSKEQHDGILHTMVEDNNNSKHTMNRFRTPEELLRSLDTTTLENLKQAGIIIREESLQETVPNLSWEVCKPEAEWNDLDKHTTGSKLFPYLTTQTSRNILRNLIHTKNAQEPEQVGYLYNLISFKGCNSTGPDCYRIKGGSQAVPLAIAKTVLKPNQLSLGDPVISIRRQQQQGDDDSDSTGNNNHDFVVTTKSGKTFTTKTIIVSGSPPAIQQLHFDPPWPAIQAQLLQRMPMGTTRKCIAIYNKEGPWWRSVGLTGDILATGLPPSLSVNGQPLFPECFDNSPCEQNVGVLTCFVEGNANLHFSSLSQQEQKELFLEFLQLSLADFVPATANYSPDDIWKPDEIVMYDWSQDPYVRGAYTGYFGPGVLSQPMFWSAYRQMEKIPNVFLAGSDYHVGYGCGYMEGAVRSGQKAADLIWERLEQQQQQRQNRTVQSS